MGRITAQPHTCTNYNQLPWNDHLSCVNTWSVATPTPTKAPTPSPTPAPTYKNCMDSDEIYSLDWNELQNSNVSEDIVPDSNFSISLNQSTLELVFDIDLEYLGSSFDTFSDHDNLGTTYVIDFQSFGTYGAYIDEPGNCQNRMALSFDPSAEFSNYWTFRYFHRALLNNLCALKLHYNV